MPTAYVGRIVNPKQLDELDYIENGIIVVDEGKIVTIEAISNLNDQLKKYQVKNNDLVKLTSKQWCMPGFVDTHIHAPQYPNIGLGYDLPLLEWLDKYTFPLEAKFSQVDFATKVYETVVKRTLNCGTTTASYYATIHVDSALILASTAIAQKQRAFIGKVNMNRDSPPELLETTDRTLSDTETFLGKFPKSDTVKPVITPRFALSCDMEAMKGLAMIAAREKINIQTHISENEKEVSITAQEYPDMSSYAGVYGEAGLLTNKTILAHGVYLTQFELEYIKKKGSSIAHCPNSNISLQSGLCPVRHLLNTGLTVGLGTDCSGGYSVSMMDSIRWALATSIAVSKNRPDLSPLTIPEVLYLATLGGATALGIGDVTGNFVEGKSFDAIIVDMESNPEVDLLDDTYTFEQLVQKFVYLGDDRNVSKVYVNGETAAAK